MNAASHGKAVVVVEHDDVLREALTEVLRMEGWDARAAADVAEATSLVRAQRPDVLVLDMRPNRTDARDFLAEVRALEADSRSIAVVLTTTSALDKPFFERADYVLRKPFELDAFLEKVALAGKVEQRNSECRRGV
jgi:DNA-binding response OmpR family regulator